MHYNVVHPGEVPPLKDVVHHDEVPPLEEMVQLVKKVPQDVVPLMGEVALDREEPLEDEVHLNRVLLDVVHPGEVPPLVEMVPLVGEPAEDKMVEDRQCKRKLQQMEADSPAVNVIVYVYIVSKLEM